MGQVDCPACGRRVWPRPPLRNFWTLIVAFWLYSLLFGIGSSLSVGWGGLMLIAWIVLACAVAFLGQPSRSWTCPSCGASLLEPPQPPLRAP